MHVHLAELLDTWALAHREPYRGLHRPPRSRWLQPNLQPNGVVVTGLTFAPSGHVDRQPWSRLAVQSTWRSGQHLPTTSRCSA